MNESARIIVKRKPILITERCEMANNLNNKLVISVDLHSERCNNGRYNEHENNIKPDIILNIGKSFELLNKYPEI